MSTAIDKIGDGIKKKDWGLVIDGYMELMNLSANIVDEPVAIIDGPDAKPKRGRGRPKKELIIKTQPLNTSNIRGKRSNDIIVDEEPELTIEDRHREKIEAGREKVQTHKKPRFVNV